MALLAQPVERSALERDAVVARPRRRTRSVCHRAAPGGIVVGIGSRQFERAEVTQRGGSRLGSAREAARHIACAHVLAQESRREGIARAGRVEHVLTRAAPRTRCADRGRARARRRGRASRRRAGRLRCATASSASISAASPRCRPKSPTSSSVAQRSANATGSPTSLAFVKSTARRPRGRQAMTDSKNVEALTECRGGQQVAARDRVALPRAHAEACQHALVVALEDALAVGRHADVLDGRRAGHDVEARRRRRSRFAAPRTRSAPGVVSDRSHDRDGVAGRAQAARMHGHVEADPAGARRDRGRPSDRRRNRPRRRSSRARGRQRRDLLEARAPAAHQARAHDGAVCDRKQRAGVARSEAAADEHRALAGARARCQHVAAARAAPRCGCP